MIEIENLSFSYGSQKVLENVDMTVKSGEVTMLLGRNGAGKTTLFRCILGLTANYKGSIKISGKETKEMSAKEIAKYVAYIPQVHYPSFNYSVLDMVLMGTGRQVYAFSKPKREQYEVAEKVLDEVGISYLSGRDFLAISGGEQQMTLIARALAQNTPILLMDEPTSSLDYGNQIKVMEQVRRLADSGYTILMSTHNPQHALIYADSIVALKNGTVLSSGKPEKLLTSNLVKTLYGVDAQVENAGKLRVIVPVSNTRKER